MKLGNIIFSTQLINILITAPVRSTITSAQEQMEFLCQYLMCPFKHIFYRIVLFAKNTLRFFAYACNGVT